MDDPRVINLVREFLRGRYFDNEFEAWRAAKRLVQEMDKMAAEDEAAGAVDPTARHQRR
jgi:hypothetical protein